MPSRAVPCLAVPSLAVPSRPRESISLRRAPRPSAPGHAVPLPPPGQRSRPPRSLSASGKRRSPLRPWGRGWRARRPAAGWDWDTCCTPWCSPRWPSWGPAGPAPPRKVRQRSGVAGRPAGCRDQEGVFSPRVSRPVRARAWGGSPGGGVGLEGVLGSRGAAAAPAPPGSARGRTPRSAMEPEGAAASPLFLLPPAPEDGSIRLCRRLGVSAPVKGRAPRSAVRPGDAWGASQRAPAAWHRLGLPQGGRAQREAASRASRCQIKLSRCFSPLFPGVRAQVEMVAAAGKYFSASSSEREVAAACGHNRTRQGCSASVKRL